MTCLSLLPTHQAEPRTTQERYTAAPYTHPVCLSSTYNKKKKQKTCQHNSPCRKHLWKHISTQNTNYQRHQQSKERMPLPAVDYQSRRRITDSLSEGCNQLIASGALSSCLRKLWKHGILQKKTGGEKLRRDLQSVKNGV